MLLNVRHVRQASPLSYVVKYVADVQIIPHHGRVDVDVLTTFPDDADAAEIAEAVDAIRRGAESVLLPRGSGAIMRLKDLWIHPVDFSPQKFEQHTAEEFLRAFEAEKLTSLRDCLP